MYRDQKGKSIAIKGFDELLPATPVPDCSDVIWFHNVSGHTQTRQQSSSLWLHARDRRKKVRLFSLSLISF